MKALQAAADCLRPNLYQEAHTVLGMHPNSPRWLGEVLAGIQAGNSGIWRAESHQK